ncbi:hypothetical protein BJ170DRAFT_299620 [Xylariales sp. AK1849]|nr:hypothetical protein BJ170DRAFT_299620 [Xylariales sp. AK1849]
MSRRRGQSSTRGSVSTTNQPITRQTRSASRAAEAVYSQHTPREDDVPRGKLQQSKYARRFAPLDRSRGQSVESVATDDFQKSSLDITDGSSPSKRRSIIPPVPRFSEGQDHNDDGQDDDLDDGARPTQDLLQMVLPELDHCTERVHDHLAALDDDFSPPGKEWWAKLKFLEGLYIYNSTRRFFARDEEPFITEWSSYDGLPDIEATVVAKTRKIIGSANLVSLRKLVVQVKHEKMQAHFVLENLDEFFPQIFHIGQDHEMDHVDTIYDLAFRIRCCYLAERIKHSENIAPFILAAELFCSQESPKLVRQAKEMLPKGPFESIGMLNVNEEDHGLTQKHWVRMRVLCSRLTHKDRAEILKDLEGAYPLKDLLDDLNKWALAATRNMKEQAVTNKANAVEVNQPLALHRSLERLTAVPTSSRDTNKLPHPTVESGPATEVEARKMLEQPKEKEPPFVDHDEPEPESDSEEEIVYRTEDFRASYFDGSAALPQEHGSVGGRHRVTPPSNQQANKRILALDAEDIMDQPRASAPNNSSGNTQVPSGSRNAGRAVASSISQMNGQKRPTIEDDDDNDDVFEMNDRPADKRRRVAKGKQIPAGRPSSSQRMRISGTAPSEGSARSASLANSSRSQVRSAWSEARQGGEDLQPNDMMLLSQQAKVAPRLLGPAKVPQRRVFWDQEDTWKLIEAVPKYMCAWSQMEEAGLFSTSRSQQAIRDKARNLKVDVLVKDLPLYFGFDGVALGKKEKDYVKKYGRNPDRTEEDLDEEDNIINNIWVAENDAILEDEEAEE